MEIKEIFTKKTIITIVITFLLIITSYTALATPQTQIDPIKTKPTGFSGVPPVGPAIPVIPIPISHIFDIFLTPSAICLATSSETDPFSSRIL